MAAVATGHHLTSQTAIEILKAGGNAFDAALAAFMTMFITEPCMASAGAAGFALTHNAGKTRMYDFFCQTPHSRQSKPDLDFHPIVVDFGNDTETFHIGIAASAVPGAIAGIFKIHKDLGRLPFKELIAIPSELAIKGVELNNFQAHDLELLGGIMGSSKTGKEIFFDKENKIKTVGQNIKIPQLADFLNFIEREGERGFYKGEISRNISEDSLNRGGFLQRSDFENYKVGVYSPIDFQYRSKKIKLTSSPSLGGKLVALFLNRLDKMPLHEALAQTYPLIHNPSKLYICLKEECGLDMTNWSLDNAIKGTSHLNVIDDEGNGIALSTTIGEGSGYFIPNTGMQMNNMLGEAFLLPEGFHKWKLNSRLQSMMCPVMVVDEEDKLIFSGGTGGASRIPFALGQVLRKLFENKLNLKEAIDHPRMHFQDEEYKLENEILSEGFPTDLPHRIWDKSSLYFGGVHAIMYKPGRWEAVGDDRREGHAWIG